MAPRMPAGRIGRRLAAIAIALLPLTKCGPGRDQFAPACPRPELLRQLADVIRYQEGSGRQDASNLQLIGRILSITGECKAGSSPGQLNSTIHVTIDATRGPALQGRQATMYVFVAVAEAGTILNKQIFPVQVDFSDNLDRVTATLPPVDLTLPVTPEKSGAAYSVIVGFQLTPEEREANQRQLGSVGQFNALP